MANRIQLRRDTAANWTRVNPVLEDGEPGLEINTNKVKYGDGNTRWNALPYASDSTSNTHIEYTDDTTGYTSTIDLTYNFNVDTDNSHVDINGSGSWSIGSTNFDTKIFSTTYGSSDPTTIIVRANDNDWIFGNTGNLTLPDGGLINYANGVSILSGIGNNTDFSDLQDNVIVNAENKGLIVDAGGDKRFGFMKYYGIEGALVHNSSVPIRIGRTAETNITQASAESLTTEVYIAADGKVGIGPNVTSPSEQLEVAGNVKISGGYGLTFDQNDIGAPAIGGTKDRINLYPIPGDWSYGIGIESGHTWFNTGAGSDGIKFYNQGVHKYTFANTGITFPDNTVQTTAYTGSAYGNTEVASYLTTYSGSLSAGNVTVGNLVVNGNVSYINVDTYVIEDNILQVANANPADTLDIGFIGHRTVDSTLEHTGLVRDADSGIWRLFSNVTAQPGGTVDFTNANYDVLQVGGLNTVNITTTGPVNFTSSPAPSVTPGIVWPSGFQTDIYGNTNVATYLSSSTIKTVANLAVSGTAPSSVAGSAGDTVGMIRVDDDYVYYCTSTFSPNSYTVGWGGAVNNTLFLTQGSYPTPQVGWTVSQGGLDFTIDTISDDGYGSWQITWVGTPYGSPTGGTATLTNPDQPAIWKSIPLTTFQTTVASTYSNANVASYLPTYSGNIGAGNIVTTGATSGNISGANYVSANVFQVSTGIFWANGTAWSSSGGGTTYSSTGGGNVTISGSAINLTLSGPGAVATGSSTAIPVITTDAYGRISAITSTSVVAPAGTLSGSTLNATVTASSLTSVGTLATLSVTGNVSTGNVSATQVTATTGAYSGNVTAANIVTTGTYGNITGANVISANTVTVTTTVRTVPVTFANLPSASAVGAGARAFITDANTTTFASAVSGSGANSVPVYSNGTGWFVG